MHLCMVCKTWGNTCGIAEHTRELVQALSQHQVTADVVTHLNRRPAGYAAVHLQHEYSLHSFDEVHAMARQAAAARVPLLVTLHSVSPDAWVKPHHQRLAAHAHLIVQTVEAYNHLIADGVPAHRLTLIPQGCPQYPGTLPPRAQIRRAHGLPADRFIVGYFGFLGRHKGLDSLCRAVLSLPWATGLLRTPQHFLAGAMSPAELYQTLGVQAVPTEPTVWQNLLFYHQPLPTAEILEWMHATDINVLPYDDGPVYASSASARLLLATGRPLMTTRTTWFSDLAAVAVQIPATDRAEGIRQELERLHANPDRMDDLTRRARQFAHWHAWPQIATHYAALYTAVRGS